MSAGRLPLVDASARGRARRARASDETSGSFALAVVHDRRRRAVDRHQLQRVDDVCRGERLGERRQRRHAATASAPAGFGPRATIDRASPGRVQARSGRRGVRRSRTGGRPRRRSGTRRPGPDRSTAVDERGEPVGVDGASLERRRADGLAAQPPHHGRGLGASRDSSSATLAPPKSCDASWRPPFTQFQRQLAARRDRDAMGDQRSHSSSRRVAGAQVEHEAVQRADDR